MVIAVNMVYHWCHFCLYVFCVCIFFPPHISLASLKHLCSNRAQTSMCEKEAKKLLSHKALKGPWLT